MSIRNKLVAWLVSLALAAPAYADGIYNPGTSGGGGSGTVTSIATGCQATGGTITTSGTISTAETPTTLSGSNPAITTGYCGGLENLSNASSQVPTIAEAGTSGFPTGWFTDLCNIGAGTQTLTPAAGTVGGAPTFVFPAGSAAAPYCIRIVSDGVSNYDVFSSIPQTVGFLNAANAWTGNESHSGTELFTGTTTPTTAAGDLFLGGVMTAPTLNANGEGVEYLSSTGGLIIAGQGSTDDIEFLNKNGGLACHIPSGSGQFTCSSTFNGSSFSASQSANSLNAVIIAVNSNTGSSAGTQFALGNNTSQKEYTVNTLSSANTPANGTILQQAGSKFEIQAGGTAGSINGTNVLDYGITTPGAWSLPSIGSDATHTDATVCEDTTSHSVYSGSGTLGVCLGTSSERYKHDIAPLDVGLSQIMALQPVSYKYNVGYGDPNKLMYGFTAEQGEGALPRLTGLDTNGKPNTFDYLGVVPVLVRAIQEQQAEIIALKAKQ